MKCRLCGKEFRFADDEEVDVIKEGLCFCCWTKKHPYQEDDFNSDQLINLDEGRDEKEIW